ncbi:MAG: outer membrane beta-barrel family protein [Bacteroidia bacterium]
MANKFQMLHTRIHALLFLLLLGLQAVAQPGQGFNRQAMNVGRFYGKIVGPDGKGVSYATVQLWGMRPDTATRSMKEVLVSGQIARENGDFDLRDLPVMGEFTLKVSSLGFAAIEQKVSFGLTGGPGGAPGGAPGTRPAGGAPGGFNPAMMQGGANFDKDLGNIVLATSDLTIGEVVIEGETSAVSLALDKKVFRVDKNVMAAGGTGIDAIRNVPSLTVDLDGNVSLRNAAPQIFVDGRPTTLSLDQIPADAIESIEVITNPSAKYDAGGGQAGIINIVMKKDRRLGYNGNIRLGGDTRLGYNTGGDINIREGKINAFASVNVNRFRNVGIGETTRENLFGTPLTNLYQDTESDFTGRFANARAGIDWFVDNRNTLTFSGSYTNGRFAPNSTLLTRTDSVYADRTAFSESQRLSESTRGFENIGGSVLYKYLFPKKGRELTADANFNRVQSSGEGNFTTTFPALGIETREQQLSGGGTTFFTAQTDYVDPLTDRIKIEAGARVAIRNFDNDNLTYLFDPTLNDWVRIPNFADKYLFKDQVYAAYGTMNYQFAKWGYMVGLRAESSQYTGTLPESGDIFENDFPLSLFPSAFITWKPTDSDNLQASYTRRINRPNFFQLMPFTDFSDSLNIRRGNPDLLPEFTNSLEVSYQKILNKNNDVLASVYYKQASGLITTYQFTEYVDVFDREVVVASYANSNSSIAYGVEFTLRNTFLKIFELSSNINLYNARVDASNVEVGLVNEQFTWFVKENLTVKLPADFRLQLTGEYQSPAAYVPSGGGRGFGGPWGGVTNTAQGYTLGYWYVDAALRKDLFKRAASVSVSVQDIFRSRRTGSYTESAFFVQDTWSLRNPQLVRVNFSYRFGKPDMSLFRRKNNNFNMQGNDMM